MQGSRSLPLHGDAGKQVAAAAVVMQGGRAQQLRRRTAGGRGAAVAAAVQACRWQVCGSDAGQTPMPRQHTGRVVRSTDSGDAGKQVATAVERDGAHDLHAGAIAGERQPVKGLGGVQQPALDLQATWSCISAQLPVLCFCRGACDAGERGCAWLRLRGAAQCRDRWMRPCTVWHGGGALVLFAMQGTQGL